MHGYDPSGLQLIYPRNKKASEFVSQWNPGIFVAQHEEGYKERAMHSHGVDLAHL